MLGEVALIGWKAIEEYMATVWKIPWTTLRPYHQEMQRESFVLRRSFGRSPRRRYVFTLPSKLDAWVSQQYSVSREIKRLVVSSGAVSPGDISPGKARRVDNSIKVKDNKHK